jgi:hypothetical protein
VQIQPSNVIEGLVRGHGETARRAEALLPHGLPPWLPPPGSLEEDQRFIELQSRLSTLWKEVMHNPYAEQTVVVVPSLTLDVEEMHKLKGVVYYEERMLFHLILLAMPKTQVVFVSSLPIHQSIIDYLLQLLPGVPYSHARERLHMFACYDGSVKPLSQKILERPSLIERIKRTVGKASNSHITAFNVTPLEKQLSVTLGVPLYGAHPRLLPYGFKSGARQLFRDLDVKLADGFEDLRDENDVAEAATELAMRDPALRRVVVKLNDGFSGDGNGLFPLEPLLRARARGPLSAREALSIVKQSLPQGTRFQAKDQRWEKYVEKFREMQGVVECFIEGRGKQSPSVQLRVNPLRQVEIISTHDQILGGPDGQVFIGCRFPARRSYCEALHEGARTIGAALAEKGVLGRLSIDYLAVPRPDKSWDMYAIEINLRKGGTTHPFRTLQLLTGGTYIPEGAHFKTASGKSKFYVASDNLESERYRGLSPEDLIDITTYSGLHYASSTNTGVVFHLIGALSEFGKLGVTCIGNSAGEAQSLYDRTVQTLDEQSQSTAWMV